MRQNLLKEEATNASNKKGTFLTTTIGDGCEQLLERVPADIYDNFLAVNEKDKEPLNVRDVAHCAYNETSVSIENIRKNIPRLTIDYLRSPDFTLSKN